MKDTPLEIQEQCPYCYCLSICATVQNFQLDKQRSAFYGYEYIKVKCSNPECRKEVKLCHGYFVEKIITARAA